MDNCCHESFSHSQNHQKIPTILRLLPELSLNRTTKCELQVKDQETNAYKTQTLEKVDLEMSDDLSITLLWSDSTKNTKTSR